MSTIVHIVGTGTIGEPLIGLFTDFSDRMGIDEVTFHKRTPLSGDRAKIRHLMDRGAKLAANADVAEAFEKIGHQVSFESREALERATVVIDCTPAGNDNKEELYDHLSGPRGFLAQGSEFGFGKPYARGVNDEALVPGEDRFIQPGANRGPSRRTCASAPACGRSRSARRSCPGCTSAAAGCPGRCRGSESSDRRA